MPGQKSAEKRPEKQAYLRISRGLLAKSSPNREADGRVLVHQCLEKLLWIGDRELENQENFPPRLFVLLATVSFQPFDRLLAGIHNELAARSLDVPLIGCSVAGVLTEDQTMLEGAALVCIASRFVHARVGIAEHVTGTTNPYDATAVLCEQLGLTPDALRTKRDAFMLCFLPGFQENGGKAYRAPEIYTALRDASGGTIPMIGGVGGDDFRRESCWLFAGDQVHADSAVVALVETDLRFGIGMQHGLRPTGEFLYAKGVSLDGHHVSGFGHVGGDHMEDVPAVQALERFGGRVLLGAVAPEDEAERLVFFPLPEQGQSLFVAHRVSEGSPLEVLSYDREIMRDTPANTIAQTVHDAEIDRFHLALALRFPCAARFKRSDQVGLDIDGALAEMQRRFPGLPIVAGLVFGEIGVGHSGRNLMRNWSISNLLLSDELHPRSLHRRGYEALSKAGERMGKAACESVPAMISAALNAIVDAGFPGGMISLLFRDKNSYVIVAQDARGEGWTRIVDRTKRWADEDDILAIVAKECEARFVPDARNSPHDDQEAVDLARVISYYVAPLIAPTGEVVGGLQVDLGDMSDLGEDKLPKSMRTLLDAFASQIATALSLAIEMHEMRLSELFDQAVTVSLTKSKVEDAAQAFVNVVAASRSPLHGLQLQVRLFDAERKCLDLLAGGGPDFEVIRQHRPMIPIGDPSPIAKAFIQSEPTFVNDIEHDPEARTFRQAVPQNSPLARLYEEAKSYANLLIRTKENDRPNGVITVASFEPWFFSESIRRSMQTLGERFYVALQHAKNAEAEVKRTAEIEFLLKVTPPLGEGGLDENLRSHVARMARAASADVVSLFLWDPETEQFILRAQHGWHGESMVGKACYRLGEGLTGTLGGKFEVEYIRDVAERKAELSFTGHGKYEKQVHPDAGRSSRSEMIAIPLVRHCYFASLTGPDVNPPQPNPTQRLGILTMLNSVPTDGPDSLFATSERWLLFQVQRDMTAFLAASLAHEGTLKRQEMDRRIAELSKLLLAPVPDTYELARRVCGHLVESCQLEGCALYILDGRNSLCLAGPPCFPNCETVADDVKRADAEVFKNAQEFSLDTALGQVFQDRKALDWSDDMSLEGRLDDSVLWAKPFMAVGQIRNVLVQPIYESGQPSVGVLVAWNVSDNAHQEHPRFTAWNRGLFSRVAEYLARVLEQQRRLRDERWILFLGTIRTNLVHLVTKWTRKVVSSIRKLERQAHDPRIAGSVESVLKTIDGLLPSVMGDCNSLSGEMERIKEKGNCAVPGSYRDVLLIPILKKAMARSRQKMNEKQSRIALSPQCDASLRGDPAQLELAFSELIDNSLNATTSGSRELTIALEVAQEYQQMRICIIDQGVGMPPDLVARLNTDPRMPSQLAKDRRVPLGVALARCIVRQHGGQLTYKSAEGQGTTALILLPYIQLKSAT